MKNYSAENHGEAKRAYQNRKTGMCRIAAVILTAVLVWANAGAAFAAESRTKINSVSLTVHSTIQAGSSSGNVSVTADGGNYRVGGTEITNEDDDWKGGMTPRVEVTLYADSGYYFNCTSKSDFSFHGDDASYVTCRREDDKETLVLVMKLDKLDNGDLSVSGASWDGSSGTGSWNENTAARYYQVKLYRDDSTVMSTTSVYDTSYDFASRMTRKGWETDDFEFCVDLRAVICDLQRLTEQRRALVDPQPLGVHIWEDAAEGVVNELLQRCFFQRCQRLVAVAEDPVHGGTFLVEHHLNVGKCEGRAVIAGIVLLVFFPRGGCIAPGQLLHDLPPSGTQLFLEFPFSPVGEAQQLTVDKFDLLSNGMDTLGRHQRGAVGAEKIAAEHLLQIVYGGIGLVGLAAGNMDDRLTPYQLNIENVLRRQADALAVGNNGNAVWRHSAPSRSVFYRIPSFFPQGKQNALFAQGYMLFAQGLLHFKHGGAKLHGIKAEKDRSGGTPASRRVTLKL